MSDFQILNSSFRDPSGFLFYRDNILYRQINKSYQENFKHLVESGLYKELIDSIEQNSLEYINKITEHELDILEKLEHGTASKEEVTELVTMREKRSKGKSKVS